MVGENSVKTNHIADCVSRERENWKPLTAEVFVEVCYQDNSFQQSGQGVGGARGSHDVEEELKSIYVSTETMKGHRSESFGGVN